MTFRGGRRNIVTDGGKGCPVKSPLSRLVLFLALLFSGLGLAASAQAQTAIVTWDEPVPVSAMGGPSGMLSSGDAVDVGTIVAFRIDVLTGMTYRSPPSGCDISHDDGDTWRATITETCHITIQTSAITMFAIGPTEVALGENYTNNVIVSGGNSPFTFTLASGELPDGIRLSDRGTLSGAPREEGRFDFAIRATNEYGHFGTQFFTLTVLGAGAAPTITNVSPSTGPAEGGTSVVITGTNLTDATAVTFGGAPAASFAVITDTAITAITEAHAEGPVDVAVTTPDGSATAAGAFTYDAPVVLSLSIDDVSVVEGDSGSTFVTFNVTLDRTVPQFREVTFDIATADGTATAGVDYVALSGTGVSIGPGSIGGPVTVQILGDTLSEPNETFFVNVTNVVGATVVDGQGVGTIVDNDTSAAPTVSWSVSGGTSTNATATVGGAPLMSGDPVPLNSVVEFLVLPANGGTYTEAPTGCEVQYVSSSASGDLWRTGLITVDCAVSFTVRWVEMLPPSQNGLAATRGQAYSVQFTIGNDYGPFTDWSWLQTVGSLPAGLSLDSATGLLSGTPAETGTFTFVVDTRNGAGHHDFLGYTLTVAEPAPTITSISPTSGPTAGGTSVVITGTNLTGATGVTFGSTAVISFTVDSATQITATTSAHAEGAVDVAVTTPGGSATAAGAFTYEVPASNDASLSNLLTSAGTLNPAFAPSTTGYTVSVPSAVSSLTLTPTVADAGATITVNGQSVTSGSASSGILLVTGDTAITVVVTAQDRTTTRTYTVTVTRAEPTITLGPNALPGGSAGSGYGPVTLTANGGTGPYSFEVTAGNLPAGLSFSIGGEFNGTPTVAGSFTFTVTATDDNGFTGTREYTLAIDAPTITIGPDTLPGGSAGVTYGPVAMTADGGEAPYAFTVTTGDLPEGLSLATTGDLGGTPTEAGSFTFTVTATDDNDFTGAREYTLAIDAPAISIDPDALADGVAGSAYGPVAMTAEGGEAPYAFIVTTGDLPEGLSLATTGELNGTPTEAGNFTFTVTATDDNGFTGTLEYTLAIDAPTITISPDTLPGGSAGVAYGPVAMTADGGEAPYAFTVTTGDLPEGLSLATTGELSGMPTEAGSFTVTVTATDDNDFTGTREYTLAVDAPTILIDPEVLADGVAGSAYGPVALTADGGTGPYGFKVTAGDLPEGLSLATTGEITGTPNETGSFTFTVTATDDNDFTGTGEYTLAVDAPTISIDPDMLADGMAGSAYGPLALTADGGNEPYSFEVTAGNLPAGLSLSIGGEFNGTPTVAGSFTFTLTATDDNGFTGTREYTLAINAPTITIGPDVLPGGVAGSAYGPVAVTADGGEAPYAFTVTTGDLPEGLSLATTGELSGTPTKAGSFTFTVTAIDDNDFTGTREYTLAIDAPAIAIDPDMLPNGMAGSAYGPVALIADGGTEPHGFKVTVGDLPAGLSLGTDGKLSGTPTKAGSFAFTVTATDENGFTGSRQLSLSLSAPEIEISVPPLPDGRVNAVYEVVQLSASGGTAPYQFAVTGGGLPEGIVLAANGALSGTPTEAGDFSATVTATDGLGFTGTANLSIKIRNLNVPVARDMTLEVMAGTSGSIDLTKGATNGPFTRADIAVYPATEAGKASVRGDRAAYMLDFAAAGTFAGSASLQYTLSNADGRSAPATVTLNIIARPDPSQDPEVIGLLTAQAEAAKRFARTQTDNFNRRLEQLHDEGERRRNSMSVNIGLTQRDSDRAAYAEEDERDPVADAFRRMDAGKKESETPASGSADYNPLGNFAVWSGGYVNFAESDNGSIDLDSTLVGVSGGVDYRFTPKFVGGLGFGYGRDKTDVGGNGTESRGRAWSMAAYGSYKPTPEIFIDGLIGYGLMDFDSRRYVTATGDFATGSRGGQQIFGSLTAGYEYRQDRWLLSPYGRLEASRSKLDAFTESAGGIWGLTYGDQTIDTLSGILGLRLEYALPMDWGVFKPRARLEYTHDFEESSRASLGYADIGTLPYSIDIDQFSRDHLTIGLGFDAQIGDAWNLGFDYQTAYGSGGQSQEHTLAVKIGARF
ncbi:putative Ig domain-containing protein [Mesorhizobium sp. CAU 1732]|uniref:putative Ig domain-containing protein n=1 Tax=Mesorhizobium sp. CAU 1732 TaxID=3140358 RepID=UPI0032605CF7